MSKAAQALEQFGVAHEVRVISAHRTPEEMMDYAANAQDRGLKVIIAGAGGSAHLPGMTASHTTLPVLAVPVKRDNHDHEALWSNVKMPFGIPLATMPENGAHSAALLAIEILALSDAELSERYRAFRQKQHDSVIATDNKLQEIGWKSYLDAGSK
jgi:5-(carboxyamino)imidazole ribonucleotide mutase